MKDKTIDTIPLQVQNGTLSPQEGAHKIWALIYTAPYSYGLGTLTEDEKSDFLLSIVPDLPRILRNYDKTHSGFKTYLCGYLRNCLRNWYRKRANDNENAAIINLIAENDCASFSTCETVSSTADDLYLKRKKRKSGCEKKSKKREIAEKIAIIIALRSYSFVSIHNLDRLFRFTDISPDAFHEMLQSIQKKRTRQDMKRERIIAARNREFIMHLKYEQHLQKANEVTENYQQLLSQYNIHTQRWIKYNKKLFSRTIHCASTEDIAEVMQEKARKVYFYINHALKKNRVDWKQLLAEEEQ